MKILGGEIENNGILLPGEMRLFPFDKLCNTVVETDNTVIEIDFKKRFAGSATGTQSQGICPH